MAELTIYLRSTTSVRLAMLVGALLLASPLVVAARLRPAVSGLGTHQQLGLPPCTARILWGVRCPACGMTTSWAHLVRGQLLASLQANAGGTVLGLLTMVAVMVLIAQAFRARLPARGWFVALAWGMFIAGGVTLSDWIWRIGTGV